jgi:hypothetical protein
VQGGDNAVFWRAMAMLQKFGEVRTPLMGGSPDGVTFPRIDVAFGGPLRRSRFVIVAALVTL